MSPPETVCVGKAAGPLGCRCRDVIRRGISIVPASDGLGKLFPHCWALDLSWNS